MVAELRSWQLKRYIGLCKPLAYLMMDDVEGANIVITDDLREAFDIQQTRSETNQVTLFSGQLAYMLAQITDGAQGRLFKTKTRRMASRFGDDCTNNFFHCPKELEPRREMEWIRFHLQCHLILE